MLPDGFQREGELVALSQVQSLHNLNLKRTHTHRVYLFQQILVWVGKEWRHTDPYWVAKVGTQIRLDACNIYSSLPSYIHNYV